MRRTNEEGVALIKRWEGFKAEAYLCPAGKWTIGYGHTATARKGMVVSEAKAEALLLQDLRVAESAVEHAVRVPLTDNQFAALVSWTFNVGVGAMRSSTLVRKLNADDYGAVPAQLARWNKVKGAVTPGLVNRRAAEAGLWARGAFVASSEVQVTPPVDTSPAREVTTLSGIAAAAASAAPALTSLSGVHWAVGVVLVAGMVGLAALWLIRRRA